MSLLLVTPDAEPIIGSWRAEHVWAARYGIPAHVTVRTPFLDPGDWHDPTLQALTSLLPIEITLARLENRPGALVVLVEPDDELRRLTDTVGELLPTLPAHNGDRAQFAYHLTVVRTVDRTIRAHASRDIAPHLPIRVTGTGFWAVCGSPDLGVEHTVIASTAPSQPS